MKYTPENEDEYASIVDENRITVAVFKIIESDETGALFAAAPDLLKELETAVAWFEEFGTPNHQYAPSPRELLPQLRAAIVKARQGT